MTTEDRDPLFDVVVALPILPPDRDRAERVRARCHERMRRTPLADRWAAVDWRLVEGVLPAAMGFVFLVEIIRRAAGLL